MNNEELEKINKTLKSLWLSRMKVAATTDTFPAYYCPKCKSNVSTGVGAILVESNQFTEADPSGQILGFCKVCFVKLLNAHCGQVEFVPEGKEKE